MKKIFLPIILTLCFISPAHTFDFKISESITVKNNNGGADLTFTVFPEKQIVVMKADKYTFRLQNCSVQDVKNWTCRPDYDKDVQIMHDGKFITEKKNSSLPK